MTTRNSVIFPLSTVIFCCAIHAPRMFLIVLPARRMPLTTASSKLLGDEAMISVTLATDMAGPPVDRMLRTDSMSGKRRGGSGRPPGRRRRPESAESDDGSRGLSLARRLADELQQVRVDLILVGRADAVRRALVDLEGGSRDHLGRAHRRYSDGHDLVVIAVKDQRGHVELLEILCEIRFGERL